MMPSVCRRFLFLLASGLSLVATAATPDPAVAAAIDALPNPLILQRADPHIHRHDDGSYYYMGTVPAYDRLELRHASTIGGLRTANPKVIWRKHDTGPMGDHIWAPEIHRMNGKWYVYFAAGDAENRWHLRIYVLENSSPDPMEGEWTELGPVDTGWDNFALDATLFAHRGTTYLLWAQKGLGANTNSNLYIAPLATPITLAAPAVMLSQPDYDWEKVRYAVNEGPVILRGPDKLFLTYSAAGTGPEYCVGMLTADLDADIMDPAAWTKSPVPVFQSAPEHRIYGPGHHTFTKAEDGVTDVIVYHARDYTEMRGDPLRDPNRHTRVKAVQWREDGTPDFGVPPPNTAPAVNTWDRADLRARDSCIYPDPLSGGYLMYTSYRVRGDKPKSTVVAYRSTDLERWTGPIVVYEKPDDWWADRGIWAPEMHAYQGKYYLFLTFDSSHEFPEQWRNWRPRVKRASQILVADSPVGPFEPFSEQPTLPADMMTLDGTLWVEDGVPYMVFCHEWVQIKDGTVNAIQLKPDLSATVGEPFRLFHGSDAPWAIKSEEYGCFVTDGPWLHRTAEGKLLMLWSSFGAGGYTVGIAESTSGKLAGPWVQQAEPLYTADGGHPMLFRRFDGQLMLALHSPNEPRQEREHFFAVEEVDGTLRLK